MTMKRYMIERDLPGVGAMSATELCGAARASNQALSQLASRVQWNHSYVAGDKTFCVYLAVDEAAVREHAQLSGFPATRITEVPQMIDPTTANL
jgi:Protein of unknown function (DUF4242)